MKIFIVIPAHNEAGRIYGVLNELKEKAVPGLGFACEMVVIDDGSTDNTAKEVKLANIKVLRHLVNRGQGAALSTGNKYALDHGADVVVHFDADGQHRAEDLAKLIRPIASNAADVVLGSRFLNAFSARTGQGELKILSTIHEALFVNRSIPLARRILLLGNFLVNTFLTGVVLTDGHNGLRALSRWATQQIEITQDGYAHPTEYVTEIKRLKLRWQEAPVSIRYNITRKSLGFFDGLRILKELLLGKVVK